MPWWGWMVIGTILFGAELAVVEAEFFLVFLGASAFVTGVAAFFAPTLPFSVQLIAFATISIVSMVFFRKRVYAKLRPAVADLPHDMAGDRVLIPRALAPGESCRIEYRGTVWTARNEGASAIAAGAQARILGTQGITVQVTAAD